MPARDLHNYNEQKERVLKELKEAKAQKLPTVYLDELVFTKRTMIFREYSNRSQHLHIDEHNFYQKYKSVIATVSAEQGLILLDIGEEPNREEIMIAFVKKLAKKMQY